MALLGYSDPQTLTDDAGNTQFGVTVDVTGPGSYVGTATSDPDTGILRLGPLTPGDYVITHETRSAIVVVHAQADAIIAEIGEVGSGVASVAGKVGVVTLTSADLTDVGDLATIWQVQDANDATLAAAAVLDDAVLAAANTSAADGDDAVLAAAAADATAKDTALVAALSAGDIVFEDVATATYDYVTADAGKCKRFTHPSGCVARVLPGVFAVGKWVDGVQKGGQVEVIGLAAPDTITFPYTQAVPHATATNNHTVVIPSGADIQDHDLVFFFIQYGISKTFTPPTPAGAVFAKDGAEAGVSSGGLSTVFKAVDVTASALKGQTLTFSHTGAAVVSDGLLIVVRGAHRTTPIDGHVDTGVQSAGSAGSCTSPSLTTVAADCVGLSLVGRSTGAVAGQAFVAPSPVSLLITDFTNVGGGNASTGAGQYGSPLGLAAGTAIGNRAWTPAATVSAPGNARTISIRPHVPTGVDWDASDGTKTVDVGSVFTIARQGTTSGGLEDFLLTGKLTT